jgi:leucyl-tRNA synthetase
MEYNFREIEQNWRKYWAENKTYKVEIDTSKPKFYVLDMFPYPSGAGLHVGHPLGYIASDIYTRYKRMKGFNVLHPMGYDAFGLPAEQYAIQTGQHPAITTEENITRYREQLDKIGFSYDWSREVRTCEPNYYKWTQWAFIKMFEHWYNNKTQKAEPISELIKIFEKDGNSTVDATNNQIELFWASDWKSYSDEHKQRTLLNYRLAYQANIMVNWCPALGTVLANDEVKDGLSVRGGHPVEQKEMKQWCLRISAYAPRLLEGLDRLDWSESIKEVQRNWIGRSEGAEMKFPVKNSDIVLDIFTTRADTVFGVTFMVLAPESKLVEQLTTAEQKSAVETYLEETKKRTQRERIADVKRVSGVFSGAYAINPLTNEEIPVWISDYVLAGYGTGAIMAVPAHDSRDFSFARHFNLPITQVVVPSGEYASDTATWSESKDSKEGTMINSGFITGLNVPEAIQKTKEYVKEKGIGTVKVNFRLRDAIFSRQRYWGEPFPVYYKNGLPAMLDESKLPLALPAVDKYLPTEDGQPPLGRAKDWQTEDGHPFELSTMPGFAGSSAYYLRYMDPKNDSALVSKDAVEYWQDVDLYLGGNEHATGHLVYSRFWNKFLFDIGLTPKDEPFKKLINQGMIQGRSNFVYRVGSIAFSLDNISEEKRKQLNSLEIFVSKDLVDLQEKSKIENLTDSEHQKLDYLKIEIDKYQKLHNIQINYNRFSALHVDVNYVTNDILDINSLLENHLKWKKFKQNMIFIRNPNNEYVCGYAIEKMSKSMENVYNPDAVVEKFGADTFRMFEMFLGPLEMSKPWDMSGIEGVFKFMRKFWNTFFTNDILTVSDAEPTAEELKVLHKTIKKITSDIESFSFNTSISAFMICLNELGKCNKRAILEPIVILIAPFAPHIAEELWHQLGHNITVCDAKFPIFEEKYLVENSVKYPVSFNGKVRFNLEVTAGTPALEVEKLALSDEQTEKWLEGKNCEYRYIK